MKQTKRKIKTKKKEKKEEIEEPSCLKAYYDEEDEDYSNWIILVALFMALIVLAIFGLMFIAASACFIVPIYLAIIKNNILWLLLGLISYPIGFGLLKFIYHYICDFT